MELRVLRYVLAIAREGSLTGAAHVLHVTQPTLSRQLKELEEELGTKLFIRHSHSVSLTADGMRLCKRAEELVELFEKTEAEFATEKSPVSGDIHIGSGETRAMSLLAAILHDIRRHYPAIRIHLYSGNAEEVTERLNKGLLDFGVLIQPADVSQYDALSLPERDIWGVLMRKDAPLAGKTAIHRQDLLDKPLLLSRQAIRRTSGHNAFLAWFGEDFKNLDIAGTFNLVYNAAMLAEQGLGYVVSIGGLIDISEHSPLCFRPLEPRLETGLDLVWKKRQVFSPAAAVFLQKLQAAFGRTA